MKKIRVTLKLDLITDCKNYDDDIVTYIRTQLPKAFGENLTLNENPIEIVKIETKGNLK